MRPPRSNGSLDGDWSHPLMDAPLIGISLLEQRRAQITVARHAQDAQDCALLLDMLGIGQIR